MRITSVPQIYRHLNRWGEILTVLSKYHLANWVGRLGPDFTKDFLRARGGDSIARQPWETRVRMAAAELGPTFIKLAQILSTRPDQIGVTLAEELQKLQTQVPADPPEVVRATIESELGRPVDDIFAEFNEIPLASASIGQVHRAQLVSGEAVVLKVQHADIKTKVGVDLDILAGLAQLAELIPEFHNYRPGAIVAEFQRTMRQELDFTREERNIQQFQRDFRRDPTVHIPQTYPRWCTDRVLTMELVVGTKLSDTGLLKAGGLDLAEIARRGANLYLTMIFTNGVYHADPHPGNVLVMEDNVLGLLDFGMVGRIDAQLQEDIGEMLLAVGNQDADHLASIIMRVGATPPGMDRSALGLDVADFVAHYGSQPLDRFDLSGALKELTEMIRRYNIMLPARIAMLLKVLITLEGTSRLISPNFSLVEVMIPYQKKLLWRQLSPARRLRKLRRLYSEMEHLVGSLPRGFSDILEQVQSGKFDVHLDHRGLEPSVNRLVLGMLASALFLGSAMMISQNVWPLMFQKISALGVAGCFVSFALGLRLWRAISKSGRLDRRK